MKKYFLPIALTVILALFIILSASLATHVYVHSYYEHIKPSLAKGFHQIHDEYNLFADDTLLARQEEKYREKAVQIIENAPLYHNDYYIVLTSKVENEEDPQTDYAGVTNGRKKTVYVEYSALNYALLHELGHVVDNTYGFSESEMFLWLYNKAQEDNYYTTTAKEYFAENYRLYVSGQLRNGELHKYYDMITGRQWVNW